MPSPDYDKAQAKAHELLEKYGFEEPVVDVYRIVQGEGLKLETFDPVDGLNQVAGFFDPETKTIYVNKLDPANRIIFTIAHELGHYELAHKPEKYGVLPRFQKPGIEKEDIEKEADAFAANLLVPEDMLRNTMDKYKLSKDDTEILAAMFGVSETVMRYRMMRV